MALNARTVRWFHRWMSLVFSIALLSLSISAMYFVYASVFRAAPAQARSAYKKLDLAQVKVGIPEAASKAGVLLEKVQAQRLIMLDSAAQTLPLESFQEGAAVKKDESAVAHV